MNKKLLLSLVATVLLAGFIATSWADTTIPKKKQTELGLYITASEAFAKWQAAPDTIKILDVRTAGEYTFVGHANMATNIPFELYKGENNPKTAKPIMPVNSNFADEVAKKFQKTDTIMVMCRSGSRSAKAVNILAKAGFKNVYTVTDGFEGDKSKEGKRTVNGWKNAGASWTYKLDPKLAYLH
jgi:rhodanese-related sulfurtransferase